jgi:hypothetical protein
LSITAKSSDAVKGEPGSARARRAPPRTRAAVCASRLQVLRQRSAGTALSGLRRAGEATTAGRRSASRLRRRLIRSAAGFVFIWDHARSDQRGCRASILGQRQAISAG